MNNLANLFDEIQRNNDRNDGRVTRKNLQGAYVFGEEDRNYQPRFEEQDKLGRTETRNQFAYVGTLARSVTMRFYGGDPKYTSYIQGVYRDLYKKRVEQGFSGLTGFNMLGIVCAILYLIVKRDEKKQLSLDDLVKAANDSFAGGGLKRTVKVTLKMVQRYIKVISALIDFSPKNNNGNSNDIVDSIIDQMRRLSLKLQMTMPQRSKMNKIFKTLPDHLKRDHNPSTIAKTVVYLFTTQNDADENKESIVKNKIGITQYILKNIVPKYIKYFKK